MGRIFSLRGHVEVADNAIVANHNIFDYVSPDRRRAWKIKEAWLWPSTCRGDTGTGSDGFMGLQAMLATDTGKFNMADGTITLASDNRQCAWQTETFNIREGTGATERFMTPNAGVRRSFIVDPDTIVTKELYLNFGTTSDSTTSPKRKWSFLIVLESKDVTAAESLFQQIKGMGQKVSPT